MHNKYFMTKSSVENNRFELNELELRTYEHVKDTNIVENHFELSRLLMYG